MNSQTKEDFKEHARAASIACGHMFHFDRVGVIFTVMELAYLRGQKDAILRKKDNMREVPTTGP